ncbi:protein tyrosine phosphatase domain-containing protein 1 isoform X1 [Erpetoichthys calabaricus]|uniref:protein tyrosine phosphatase domain-containing protein 1 isoform X1 n=1 Tax=Erpetoichthys calabaricus TaxID=27687 RepID=UPI0022340AE6|nr:protein tyrosine phosphatase domain-containing protein 1 isoform X1 [Erpetoichthys calabaricus]
MTAGVTLVNNLPCSSVIREPSGFVPEMSLVNVRRPTAKYTKVGERLRHVIPGHMQCSMTCGGRACKYENPSRWTEEEQAIKGLYSSWITDNLLAMARPSTEIIEKYDIIEQFQRCGIKTIINLQRPGEHASCGNPLEQESGFTYRPEIFMEAGIYFYNFGWKDYGVASLTTILDMVKVMSFAIQEGKMAIHCHAGLGRTGVLIACYLVFATRMSADQAILFVRAKRPNSIQTRGQLLCVREFAQFLIPLRSIFAFAEPKSNAVTLSQYLIRQRHLLHGYEARQLKNVPKIIHLICKLLLDIAQNRQVIEEEILEIPDLSAELEKTVSQIAILQLDHELNDKDRRVSGSIANDTSQSALSSESEFDPLWKRRKTECVCPLSYLKRRLSYSDSDLKRREILLDQEETPLSVPANMHCTCTFTKQSLSQTSLVEPFSIEDNTVPNVSIQASSNKTDPFFTGTSVWDQRNGSPILQRRDSSKDVQRGRTSSLGSLLTENKKTIKDNELCGEKSFIACHSNISSTEESIFSESMFHISDEWRDKSEEIPFITLQSELSIESRRILVAQALAVDMDIENDKDHQQKIESWQRELNSKEGAWDRICSERDPFVLAALMWSWVEQLKEPIITKHDLQVLEQKCADPEQALYSLEKSSQQTLLCILDCLAFVHIIPDDIDEACLVRLIKAFTKVEFKSDDGPWVYNILKTIVRPLLSEKRRKITEQLESACTCLHVS